MKQTNKILTCSLIVALTLVILPTDTATEDYDGHHSDEINHNGTLSGYVTTWLNKPIEGAKITVYFHGESENDRTDETGYYYVEGIPTCKCLKDIVASKFGYKTRRYGMAIYNGSTHNFTLRPRLFIIIWGFFSDHYNPSFFFFNITNIATSPSTFQY